YYLRVHSQSPQNFILNLYPDVESYLGNKEDDAAILIFGVGFVLALVIYTAFQYFASGAKRYRFYTLWNVCNIYLHYYKNGFVRGYFEFTNPFLTDTVFVISIALATTFAGLFILDFLSDVLKKHVFYRKIFRINLYALLMCIPIACFSPIIGLYLSLALLMSASTLTFIAQFFAVRMRKSFYYLYAVAWFFVVVSSTTNVFASLGIISPTFWAHNTMIIALVFESLVIAIAVSMQGNEITKERDNSLKKQKHLLSQLKSLVYPHQIKRIENGAELVSTMPEGVSNACVISFDVQNSTAIGHEKNHAFFETLMRNCHKAMMGYYDPEKLEANAYLIKEMGDGFLCSVGYPFNCNGDMFDSAVSLSQMFIEIFNTEVEKHFHGRQVYCSIGIAYGRVNGYFPKQGLKVYDLYGDGIILATRYEGIRKALLNEKGLPPQNILIIQDTIFRQVNVGIQKEFETFQLDKIKVRDDDRALILHYRLFE
ncbi:MAG: hypothetical protein EOP48_13950, partial [Sphingobacteriales bacterium]